MPPHRPTYPNHPLPDPPEQNVIVPLSHRAATERTFAGGKAASLAALLQAGFAVPDGLVVATSAYQQMLPQLQQRKATPASGQADERSGAIHLPAWFASQLEQQMQGLPSPLAQRAALFAIRSSSTSEDAATASYAGVFTSFLNVQRPAIGEHIVKCWQAALADVVQRYQHSRPPSPPSPAHHSADSLPAGTATGQNGNATRMAVIVQPMVACRVAGVAFTADPVTHNRSTMVVTLRHGSPEALVSGTETGQALVFRRTPGRNDSLTLEAPPHSGHLLPEAALLHLGHLLQAVEAFFAAPVDVEWCWDGQQFWILQARPITHPGSRPQSPAAVWSGTNVQEILPGVPTPATWSTISYGLDASLKRLFALFGYRWPTGEDAVSSIWGRGYMNLSRVSDAAWQVFGIPPRFVAESLGGGHLAALHHPRTATLGDHLRHAANLARFALLCNQTANRSPATFRAVITWCDEVRQELRQQPGGPELSRLIRRVQQRSADFMQRYLLLVFGGVGTYSFLRRAIAAGAAQAKPTNEDSASSHLGAGSIGALLTGLGAMPSVAMSYRLRHLAACASSDPAVFAWLQRGEWDDWQQQLAGTALGRNLPAFLREYGQRLTSLSELEMAHPRWQEDPTSLFAMLQRLCETPGGSESSAAQPHQVARRVAMERSLLHAFPLPLHLPLRLLINQAQRYTRLREIAKHHLLSIIGIGREILLLAGGYLVRQGALAQVDDIFLLNIDQIVATLDAADQQTGDLPAQVAAQVHAARMQQRRFQQLEAPGVFIGGMPCYQTSEPEAATPTTSAASTLLQGVASAPGRVTARARVLHHPAASDDFMPGDILVCPTTDSTWLPLFFAASGLVVEIGGVLSHGAIIARELGIPTVTNVAGATSTIRDGQVITVDGSMGQVFRAQEA